MLVGGLLLLPTLLVRARLAEPAELGMVDRFVLSATAPVQSAVTWGIDGVFGAWGRYLGLVDVEEENDELRRRNDELARDVERLGARVARAESDAELAGFRRQLPADTIGAHVVAAATDPRFRVTRITLDRGAAELKPGMPVLARGAVVGRILRAWDSAADVLLAVDPRSEIDVIVRRTGARGLLRGIGDGTSYGCRVEYVRRSEEVQEGDVVETSGLGGAFPPGLTVGRVIRVVKGEFGLYQEVDVEPAVELSRLRSVLVVIAPPPPPDPSARERKTPPPVTGGAVPYR
ncbi:MAG: rod shape-determining protein MreC [Myxococcales bacterium]|nr:rod shape-determining protein MreC [Myxococcales bacterium]